MTSEPSRHPVHYRDDGPLLLLAGPGTGKTSQLAKRIKHLVEEKAVPPNEITVITFTAAAAANMREKISDSSKPEFLVPPDLQPRNISTMHSLGHRIITAKAETLDLPARVGVVTADSVRLMLMKDAAQLEGYERNAAEEVLGCRQHSDCRMGSEDKCKICARYRAILRACGAIDHDEQILLACTLLERDPALLADYQQQAQHLLVDEYQDINAGQFKLIQLLTKGHEAGLFVVGDDDQSIYSWRGGSPDFIRKFNGDFGSSARTETLLHSYRCHPHVLEGALGVVVAHDSGRLPKGAFTYKNATGPKIVIHDVPSWEREAVIVTAIIEDALPSKKVLVLVPRKDYALALTQQLNRAQVAYESPPPMPGEGLPVLVRLAAWVEDENDNLALRECIEAMANSEHLEIPSKRVRKAEKVQAREDAYRLLSNLWDAVLKDKKCSLWQSLSAMKGEDTLLECIFHELDALRSQEETAVSSFLALAGDCLRPWRKIGECLQEFKDWVSSLKNSSIRGASGQVRIMTLQGAKGLEADVVCVIGAEEGALPRTGVDLPEQSRLMYVSMTRACEQLHLFRARKRPASLSYQKLAGSETLTPSRFLDSIPEDHVESQYHPPRGKKRAGK